MKLQCKKVIFGLSILMTLIVFFITVIRSWSMDITYDEAYSFVHRGRELKNVIRVNIANNHLFNSALIYLIGKLWPFNEFALRVPNLVMLAVFFFTMIQLTAKIFKRNIILFAGAILFLLSGYQVFEMFSLARGYGLSAGFLSIAIYFLCKFQTSHAGGDIVICLYWAILATLSQLVSLFTFIAILIMYILMLLITGKKTFLAR